VVVAQQRGGTTLIKDHNLSAPIVHSPKRHKDGVKGKKARVSQDVE